MVNQLLVTLMNSVLGTGKPTARGNYAYTCPKCNHHKPKLEICLDENSVDYQKFGCWVCKTKGKKLINLFKAIDAPSDKILELKSIVKTANPTEQKEHDIKVQLPEPHEDGKLFWTKLGPTVYMKCYRDWETDRKSVV